jgi:hypothetical protein
MLRGSHIAGFALLAVTAFALQTERMILVRPMLAQSPTNPVAVLQRFEEAENQGDVDGAMDLVAGNVTYSGSRTCLQVAQCLGADSRREVELSISDQVQSTRVSDPAVSGTTVRVTMMSTGPARIAIAWSVRSP